MFSSKRSQQANNVATISIWSDLLYILLNQGGFAGKGAAHATDLPRVNVKIGGSEIINIKVDVLSGALFLIFAIILWSDAISLML